MLFEDTYLTVFEPSESLFKDKGSKFLSFIFPVGSEEEIKLRLSELRKLHPGANHHCYAFRLGADKQAYRANDDGEPSNTAGKPILGQIQSKDLTNILIVVVRYFGGTLLGVSGLIQAYKQAAEDAISHSKIIEKTVNDIYELRFDYLQMNDVMKIIKDGNLDILSQNFELSCSLAFSVRKSNSNKVYDSFKKLEGLKITFLSTK
ncbi:MAG: YigZ family protein [Bacteroidia bacterium]